MNHTVVHVMDRGHCAQTGENQKLMQSATRLYVSANKQ